mgnify:CR=1 FL=1
MCEYLEILCHQNAHSHEISFRLLVCFARILCRLDNT